MNRTQRVVVLAVAAVLAIGLGAAALVVQEDAEVPRDLSAVQTWDDLRTDHVGTDEIDYPQSPPVGGPHNDAWLTCGVYDRAVREENAVHSLEHGALWISYQPGLDEADLDALAGKLPEEGILSPDDEQEAPVVVTVWGAQLELTGPDDPRLDLFIEEYADGHTSPEAFAPCAGGIEAFEDADSSTA